MDFEKIKEIVISNFVENLRDCKILKEHEDLTYEQIEYIHNMLDEHKECFESEYNNYNEDNLELIDSYVYGDMNVSIECNYCNSIIIDSDVLAYLQLKEL